MPTRSVKPSQKLNANDDQALAIVVADDDGLQQGRYPPLT
jgi:hypothetical protein